MRVLHVIDSLVAGGAEKLLDESLPILQEKHGVHVEVLLLTDEDRIFDQNLKKNKIKVSSVPFNNMYSFKNIFFIKNFIIQGEYDVVHSHLFPCNYWVSLASRLINKTNKPKFITTEHNTHNRRRNKKYFKPIEKIIYSGYSKVISISESTQQNLIKWLNPKELSKYTVVENGINLTKFNNAKAYDKNEIDIRLNSDSKIICMVGSFTKQKDQATIIRALSYLPKNIHLLLIGDGPLRKENEKIAISLGVNDRVIFLGIRIDIPELFKTSDVIIVSSNWEGFGLVAAEGMATGKPVVASDVSGLSEVVGDAGILFELKNAKQLSQIVKKLISNKRYYNEKSAMSMSRSAVFNIENMIAKYLEIYQEELEKDYFYTH